MKTKFYFSIIFCFVLNLLCAQDYFYAYYSDGTIQKFPTANADSISLVKPDSIVTDICGNTYKTVIIGGKMWMAENLKCNKYDTQSEAYKNGMYIINTEGLAEDGPYYTDVTDKSNWGITTYSGQLTDEQVSKLGYCYSWAATCGVANGYLQTKPFDNSRQGICPNGWHVPSYEEWSLMISSLGCLSEAGAKLKTSTGWYPGQSIGTDAVGFSALPAGTSADYVGKQCGFWLPATKSELEPKAGCQVALGNDNDDLEFACVNNKILRYSVRCIKN